jgi:hypothetical protein
MLPPSCPLVYNNIRKLEIENTRQAKKRKENDYQKLKQQFFFMVR